MKPTLTLITALLLAPLVTHAGITEVRPVCVERDGIQRIEYHSGETLIARSADTAPAGVELRFPGADWTPVSFRSKTEHDGVIEMGPEKICALTLRWRLVQKTPSLVERTLEVTADAAQQFTAAFPLDLAIESAVSSNPGCRFTRDGRAILNYWTCEYLPDWRIQDIIDLRVAVIDTAWFYGASVSATRVEAQSRHPEHLRVQTPARPPLSGAEGKSK